MRTDRRSIRSALSAVNILILLTLSLAGKPQARGTPASVLPVQDTITLGSGPGAVHTVPRNAELAGILCGRHHETDTPDCRFIDLRSLLPSAMVTASGREAASAGAAAGATPGVLPEQDGIGSSRPPTAHAIISVKDFGALGDGTTNDTQAVQKAIDAATGVLLFPPGTYRCGNLQIANKSDLLILGQGGTLQWTGTAPQGRSLGLQLVGQITNLEISGLRIRGSGVIDDRQAGIWNSSGQTLANIRIIGNHIENVTIGISLNADLGGSIRGGLILGNELRHIVGTTSGSGYGIHHANGSGKPSDLRIIGNTITGAQRHSIYQAKGSGVVIQGNTIHEHRSGVAMGVFRPAIEVARSSQISVTENIIEGFRDGGLVITRGGPALLGEKIVVTRNVFMNPRNAVPAVMIGSLDPSKELYPVDVTLAENRFYEADINIDAIRLLSGKQVQISENQITALNVTASACAVQVYGQGETPGTARYTDQVLVQNNVIRGTQTATGTLAAFGLNASICTATARLEFRNNTSIAAAAFQTGAPVTNPNLYLTNQDDRGLKFAPGVSAAKRPS